MAGTRSSQVSCSCPCNRHRAAEKRNSFALSAGLALHISAATASGSLRVLSLTACFLIRQRRMTIMPTSWREGKQGTRRPRHDAWHRTGTREPPSSQVPCLLIHLHKQISGTLGRILSGPRDHLGRALPWTSVPHEQETKSPVSVFSFGLFFICGLCDFLATAPVGGEKISVLAIWGASSLFLEAPLPHYCCETWVSDECPSAQPSSE